MPEVVQLIHTNDFHSHFEHFATNAAVVRDIQAASRNQHEETITIDLGDHMDRFHAISEASNGQMNVRCLNELDYQYATIGNNEGITLSQAALNDLYDEAAFTVCLANVIDQKNKDIRIGVSHTPSTRQGKAHALL
ncbi:hypothetical protein G4V62_14910 [Bacillaceae bacterium SIJ1]|uniref:hypothetical protein n=1 Tax=Litoribacterium kuwaitense TaxID=1398745 RepID=UPI0013EC00B2|nr:hypothetical protein [Litoribacterium kuwaitense]NGP46176.1 hypothetical protein [Litoribacterium kuwaitense]